MLYVVFSLLFSALQMPRLGLTCLALEVKGEADAALTFPDSRAAAALPSTHPCPKAGAEVWRKGDSNPGSAPTAISFVAGGFDPIFSRDNYFAP